MVASFYHPQVPDSANIPQQADTTASPVIQQSYDTPNLHDSVVDHIPVQKTSTFQPPATAITVIPLTEAKEIHHTDNSKNNENFYWNSVENFFIQNGLTAFLSDKKFGMGKKELPVYNTLVKPASINPEQRKLNSYDWFLGVLFLLIVLFIWIRIFYSKFFSTLANALVSFQISAKLFREKNVLLQRVSIVLDFIYLVVLSLFVFELAEYFGLSGRTLPSLNTYLLFFNIIMIYTLLRIVILHVTGLLFLVQPLLSEYIHNTFVVNKGMGIALFPVIIMLHYFPVKLLPLIVVIGSLIFACACIYKGIRAYQIIIRKDVLLFYLILYLCTLEILPLLLGYKVIITLI